MAEELTDTNTQVARLVCGWQVRPYDPEFEDGWLENPENYPYVERDIPDIGSYLWPSPDGDGEPWHPSDSIAQCFEWIVPAMAVRGFEFRLFINKDCVVARFEHDENYNRRPFEEDSYCCEIPDPTKAAECIVQAAIKAVEAEQGDE